MGRAEREGREERELREDADESAGMFVLRACGAGTETGVESVCMEQQRARERSALFVVD